MAIYVALRKESVDRNYQGVPVFADWQASLSARRAWIEILHSPCQGPALRGRSPQGERG